MAIEKTEAAANTAAQKGEKKRKKGKA